jgi:general secretion pathway protein E
MRIEPSGDSFTVHVQRDGAYEHWAAPAVEVQALVAALWRRAGLPESLDAAVPAGQFQWRGAGADWQMQVFPMNGGAARPGLLVRWRDPAAPVMPLERLGLTRLAEWRRGISLPQGLCLVAGTTGSGSSTTLEASAHYLRQQGRAVWDCRPEREAGAAREAHAVPGAVPDAVVLFGEIRDAQAAREAARLAEGRLVLASVHASSLSRAMARLVSDLDLPVTVLGHVLQVALAQTLLRRTCSQCAAGPDSARAQCASCRGTGYAGRVMVSECVQADGRNLLVQLHRLEGQGHSMLDDAVEKCREGLTDVAELTRIFGAEAPQRMAAPAG